MKYMPTYSYRKYVPGTLIEYTYIFKYLYIYEAPITSIITQSYIDELGKLTTARWRLDRYTSVGAMYILDRRSIRYMRQVKILDSIAPSQVVASNKKTSDS